MHMVVEAAEVEVVAATQVTWVEEEAGEMVAILLLEFPSMIIPTRMTTITLQTIKVQQTIITINN